MHGATIKKIVYVCCAFVDLDNKERDSVDF